jgi:hypothetical protein
MKNKKYTKLAEKNKVYLFILLLPKKPEQKVQTQKKKNKN